MAGEQSILDHSVEFLKGVGPHKADLLKTELGIFKFSDLLFNYPFRYVDKTVFHLIKDIHTDGMQVQIKGKLVDLEVVQGKRQRRLTAVFKDESGFVKLVWFKGINWIRKALQINGLYVVYGKLNLYKGKKSIPHPEMELAQAHANQLASSFDPVYSSTEKLSNLGLDSKGIKTAMKHLLDKVHPHDLIENIPAYLIEKLRLIGRYESVKQIHFPENQKALADAQIRIKFEELFFLQLRLLLGKELNKQALKGHVVSHIGDLFNSFYKNNIPFELTHAQKRVLKEIRADLGSGHHMNRLLQGDVGSGKTIVGLMAMLMAIDNGFQTCLMAPTEILANQHYVSLQEMSKGLGLRIGFLSGSVKGNKRKELLKLLALGEIHILIGTHALIEAPVVFKNLGLAITDEQHRFGVAQRAKLWGKNSIAPPHVLVMTATPIPRTLAMTVYGDLDVSVIDELPPGRKDIQTTHMTESRRMELIKFMRTEIKKGRQIYIVFPLIEESAKLDLQNLQTGYELLQEYFPPEEYSIAVVHGRMKAADKDFEMARFVKKQAQIMVATTVIEVGVNVPNASIMIIENTERFGLSQLHQLRGRVGRGSEQSYCILMSSYKLSAQAKERIQTMVRTNNGFEIAEADMNLRGAGDIEGTMQSGKLELKLANLMTDQKYLETARHIAISILEEDPLLEHEKNLRLRTYMKGEKIFQKSWGRIS